jgi:hypothetical protein
MEQLGISPQSGWKPRETMLQVLRRNANLVSEPRLRAGESCHEPKSAKNFSLACDKFTTVLSVDP